MVDGGAMRPGWWVGADRCLQCHAPASSAGLCHACLTALPWNTPACWHCAEALPDQTASRCPACLQRAPPWHGTWCALRFEAPIVRWIHALKYHADLSAARRLALLLAHALRQHRAPPPELLVPMPLFPARMRLRGFNQAQLLADTLGHALRLRAAPAAARRLRDTADQTELSAKERRRNLRGAFAADARQVAGRHVAIVDDVLTTGASCHALSLALRNAGAVRIDVWCVARTP
ncbi:MAG: ComF family protein [Proteobacteria bacterium]|nr:ComF family protein [Pseudomonadota bacterium]